MNRPAWLTLPANRSPALKPAHRMEKVRIELILEPVHPGRRWCSELKKVDTGSPTEEVRISRPDRLVHKTPLILFRDEILITTKIRRYTMAELSRIQPSTFIVKPEIGHSRDLILCSEVPDHLPFYDTVDERGYQAAETFRIKPWPKQTVDELIESCTKREAKFPRNNRQPKANKNGSLLQQFDDDTVSGADALVWRQLNAELPTAQSFSCTNSFAVPPQAKITSSKAFQLLGNNCPCP